MKKIISVVLVLAYLMTILCGCPSSSSKERTENEAHSSEQTVQVTEAPTEARDGSVIKGKWLLAKEEVTYTPSTYTAGSGEVVVSYTARSADTFSLSHAYTPDPDDPSDGSKPYVANYSCYCTLPDEFYPGQDAAFYISAVVDNEPKEGCDGVCCSFDLRGMILDKEKGYGSKLGYSYDDSMFYPVYAGKPVGYGHWGDSYQGERITDTVTIPMPQITADMNPSSYELLVLEFLSNAGNSRFVYVWSPEE
ncbi:MAG: hypothetical protein IJJ99_04440 [Oscillospiraceae bacterium]|nr:hypothetical protein [Oscillospiraceae bacterium]